MSKVVLVTGATSGIGCATATLFSEKGYRVYGVARTIPADHRFPFSLLRMDVSDVSMVKAGIDAILQKEQRIDIVINNAGVGLTGPIEEVPNEQVERMFAINFYGPINVIKAVLPQMRTQQQGLIVNITSIAGYMGLPYRGSYCASKSALETLTETIRMEVKPFGVHVVALAPGDIATSIDTRRYHFPSSEQSPYSTYDKVLRLANDHLKGGGNPRSVAKKIYAISQKKSPRIHYKVGTLLERMSIVLKRILSDAIFEKLIMNHYK